MRWVTGHANNHLLYFFLAKSSCLVQTLISRGKKYSYGNSTPPVLCVSLFVSLSLSWGDASHGTKLTWLENKLHYMHTTKKKIHHTWTLQTHLSPLEMSVMTTLPQKKKLHTFVTSWVACRHEVLEQHKKRGEIAYIFVYTTKKKSITSAHYHNICYLLRWV